MKSFSKLNNSEHLDDGHYWISISDLMMSVLFIFILILTYTVFTMSKVTESYISNESNRAKLLRKMQQELNAENVPVDINETMGNMRLKDKNNAYFKSGQAELSPNGKIAIHKIALAIERNLKNKEYRTAIDTIFIEGHTDTVNLNTNYGNRRWTNMELSAERAIYTYLEMERVINMKVNGRYLFSYSGYGDKRPIEGEKNIANNRRIEFFFALAPVKKAE